jgi:glycerate-2-kinase
MEFVLHMLKQMKSVGHPFHVLSIGTDGIDGSTDAAGAWIDQESMYKAIKADFDIDHYLKTHHSYHFFKEIDQLIITGPTHTNVMDLRMFYIPTR